MSSTACHQGVLNSSYLYLTVNIPNSKGDICYSSTPLFWSVYLITHNRFLMRLEDFSVQPYLILLNKMRLTIFSPENMGNSSYFLMWMHCFISTSSLGKAPSG